MGAIAFQADDDTAREERTLLPRTGLSATGMARDFSHAVLIRQP